MAAVSKNCQKLYIQTISFGHWRVIHLGPNGPLTTRLSNNDDCKGLLLLTSRVSAGRCRLTGPGSPPADLKQAQLAAAEHTTAAQSFAFARALGKLSATALELVERINQGPNASWMLLDPSIQSRVVKFRAGQSVLFAGPYGYGPPEIYVIVRELPERDGEAQYKIRSADSPRERVAKQSQLRPAG